MRKVPKLQDADWLLEQARLGRTKEDVAKILGCVAFTVHKYCKQHGIEMRWRKRHTPKYPELYDYAWMFERYVTEDLSDNAIARLVGTTSHGYIATRRRALGIKDREEQWWAGERHNWWKGGRRKRGNYITCRSPGHPHARADGHVFEHRLVMEQVLGRYLEPDEVVHHINGIGNDNQPENLIVFSTNAEHLREGHEQLFGPGNRCPTCGRVWPGKEGALHE